MVEHPPVSGSGLTIAQIDAFDSYFSTLVGTTESKREKDKLIKLLKDIEIVNYTITVNGENFTIDNDLRSVEENQSWTANITYSDGFEADTITVIMGDSDVTETTVNGDTITISEITDDVIVTVTAKEITEPTTLLYSNDGIVFTDGSDSLHTGVNLSEYTDYTILINVKSLTNFLWGNQCILSSGTAYGTLYFIKYGNGEFRLSSYSIPESVLAKKTSNFEESIPVAIVNSNGTYRLYSWMDGAMVKTDDITYSGNMISGELIVSPLRAEAYNADRWLGEIANIKVYSEVLSDSAISEYMRRL